MRRSRLFKPLLTLLFSLSATVGYTTTGGQQPPGSSLLDFGGFSATLSTVLNSEDTAVAHAAGQNLDVSNYTTLNEVENNYLSHTEEQERTTLKTRLKECKASGSCSTDEMQGYQASIDELDALDKARDQAFLSACGNDTGSAQCTAEVEKYLEIRDSWDGKFAEGVTGIREYTQSDLLLGQYVTLNRLKTQHPEIDPKAIDALAELDLPTAVAEVLDLPPEVVGIISMTNPKNWIKKGGQTIAKAVKVPRKRSVGAMKKLKFQPSPKHGTSARNTSRGVASHGPTNGQHALDNSVQVKDTSLRRVGVDKASGEIVVFDQTSDGIFHGHVRSFKDLTSRQQNALRNAGLIDKKGNF